MSDEQQSHLTQKLSETWELFKYRLRAQESLTSCIVTSPLNITHVDGYAKSVVDDVRRRLTWQLIRQTSWIAYSRIMT